MEGNFCIFWVIKGTCIFNMQSQWFWYSWSLGNIEISHSPHCTFWTSRKKKVFYTYHYMADLNATFILVSTQLSFLIWTEWIDSRFEFSHIYFKLFHTLILIMILFGWSFSSLLFQTLPFKVGLKLILLRSLIIVNFNNYWFSK